jgi:hypothetical protein
LDGIRIAILDPKRTPRSFAIEQWVCNALVCVRLRGWILPKCNEQQRIRPATERMFADVAPELFAEFRHEVGKLDESHVQTPPQVVVDLRYGGDS